MPRIIEPQIHDEDRDLEQSLRPTTFDDFIGQGRVKNQLSIFIQAARERGKRSITACCMALRDWGRRRSRT